MSQLVIVGAPGAGKSTVGSRVAHTLGAPFLDTDQMVESESGSTVADIFVSEGEAVFRAREADAVARAIAEPDAVVSLGGGAILDPATRELLGPMSVVWLKVQAADAARRVGLSSARPLLLGNVRSTLIRLLDERTPLYESVATVTVDAGRPIDDVVADVMEWVSVQQHG